MDAATGAERPPWAETAAEVRERLAVPEEGLSEAEAARRLAAVGPNSLPEAPGRTLWARIGAQLSSTLILVLIAAAGITAVLGHWVDSAVIVGVVVANTVIGVVQEGRAARALEGLRSLLAPRATVIRGGRRRTIAAAELVPGDLVRLDTGDLVPADLRLVRAERLAVEEAMLTGESVPVPKRVEPVPAAAAVADRASMVFSGTLVVRGTALGIVTATGARTEIGRIGRLVAGVEQLSTPLIRQMDRFGRQLTAAVLAAALALLAYALLALRMPFAEAFMIVVGLFVAAIPEGLPAVLTVTLAIGVQAMARRHAVVRQLPSIETLGAVTVICTDKTGTLTLNEMTVETLATAAGRARLTGVGYAPEGHAEPEGGALPAWLLRAAAEVAALCNDSHLIRGPDGWRVEGDPMEGALLAFAGKLGLAPAERPAPAASLPFDSAHRYMAVLHEAPDGFVLRVKGAPEVLIARAARQLGPAGVEPIDPAFWLRAAEEIAAAGQRVLALAFAPRPAAHGPLEHADVADLTLVGLVGLIDPPRPEAIRAVADCRAAGIEVKMITGDHAGTAVAIAREIGLSRPDAVLTGADLEAMDDAALARAALETDVFARTSPEHKLRLVAALQARGAVVAMTGDGVNDAPALKRADIGIAMGRKGSEAARAASDVVLTDDNFASIAEAVRQGRTVYANLQKVIKFLLPINGGESVGLAIAVLFGLMLPITPLQILWVNMVSSVGLALSLAFEPPERDVMRRPPRRPDAPILTAFILWRVVLVSALFSAGIFGQFFLALEAGASVETARTLAVNTLVAMEVFYLFAVRYALGPSATAEGVRGTPPVLLAVAAVCALQALFTYAPPMNALFGTAPLSLAELARCAAAGVAVLAVIEIDKWAARVWRARRDRPA